MKQLPSFCLFIVAGAFSGLDDIIAARPKSVWFQLGIRNDEAARRLAEVGIKVVQDRCLMVEHRNRAG